MRRRNYGADAFKVSSRSKPLHRLISGGCRCIEPSMLQSRYWSDWSFDQKVSIGQFGANTLVSSCRWRAAPGLWHRQRGATDSKPHRILLETKQARCGHERRADLATPHDGNGPASLYRRVYRRYFNTTCVQRFVSLATGQVSIARRRMRSCSVRSGL